MIKLAIKSHSLSKKVIDLCLKNIFVHDKWDFLCKNEKCTYLNFVFQKTKNFFQSLINQKYSRISLTRPLLQ